MNLVCKKCGKDDGLYEELSVRATEAIEVTLDASGKPTYSTSGDRDIDDWGTAEHEGYGCSCGATAATLKDLVAAAAEMLEPGEIVICSDGLRGTVERQDGQDVYVEGFPVPFPLASVTQCKNLPRRQVAS